MAVLGSENKELEGTSWFKASFSVSTHTFSFWLSAQQTTVLYVDWAQAVFMTSCGCYPGSWMEPPQGFQANIQGGAPLQIATGTGG